MKRICLSLIALAGFAVPAMAETPSKNCMAAIKLANTSRKPVSVPSDCWRMGPLRLGVKQIQARTLLGAPGASQNFTLTFRRKKMDVTRLFYVYPRNLENWLRLVPSRQADFNPITLKLDFSKDLLVAVSVDHAAHMIAPVCKPSAPGRRFARRPAEFPYGLHGVTLGAKLDSVEARFGKFANTNAAKDFHIYGLVPLSVQGKDSVTGLRFATGAPFESGGGTPDFTLKLDPASCFVTGFALGPGH